MKTQCEITDSEIRAITEDYARELPGWELNAVDTIFRVDGPVMQVIWLQRLSIGDYRPMNSTSVLAAPAPDRQGGGEVLFAEVARGRHSSSSVRLHASARDGIIATMQRQFIPAISAPLDAGAVFTLCDLDASLSIAQVYALAALNAFVGNFDRAVLLFTRFIELVGSQARPRSEPDLCRQEFLDTLRRWIDKGEAQQNLSRIVDSELTNWRTPRQGA